MIAFIIVLLVLQGLGLLFKLVYLMVSIGTERTDKLSGYCMLTVLFSALFEVGFILWLVQMCS